MGAPVAARNFMAPPTWSMCAWVMTICFTCRLCLRTSARMLWISSPGSITMASRVLSSPMMEQLHCSAPTGRISWIMVLVVGRWSFVTGQRPKTNDQRLFLCRRSGWRRWLHWLRLGGRGFDSLQYRVRTTMARSENRQRDRGHHKDDGRPGGCFRQNRGRAAWAEGGLAAHASESCCNVAALPALQQYHDDEKQTNRNVDDRYQYDHELNSSSTGIFRRLVLGVRGLCFRGLLSTGKYMRWATKRI